MIEKILELLFGSKEEKDLKKIVPTIQKINAREAWATKLSAEQVKEQTKKFQEQLQASASQEDILIDAFALAREAARRVLGERPYDVQILGGIALHQGRIMEMKTGEGKTLSLVAPAYLNALDGRGVHVVTVNDYLAERDSLWMGPIFNYLGLRVGKILSGMDNDQRRENYAQDLTYGTNNEFGFDYLRDNMCTELSQKVQRPFNYCIIDEIDSVLIDEARTPLIISGAVDDNKEKIIQANQLAKFLIEVKKDPKTGDYPLENPLDPVKLEGDFKVDEKSKRIIFTEDGVAHIEKLLQDKNYIASSIYDDENFDFIHYFTQALRALRLFHNNDEYVIQGNHVQIVDEFTGRILEGRRYSDGLHQAIEAKENISIAKRNRTLATITFQKYFMMYSKLAGMTGTASTERREFSKIYNLDVVVIPTNKPVARKDVNDSVYINLEAKLNAIGSEVKKIHATGQPILIGTVSVEASEIMLATLQKFQIKHEVLNAKNHHREAAIIAEAGALNSVTIATNMAGRGTDIKLGGNYEIRAQQRMKKDSSPEQKKQILAGEYKRWQIENSKVKEVGGLYVLGTERHESRRIDNQLRGRSGRQGDPGFSRFFISLDDELMRLFGGERFKSMMARLGMEGDEPLEHNMISRAIARAQNRVEDRNYETRKHLIDYDDVLNKQRTYIYKLRNEALGNASMIQKVEHTARNMVDIMSEDYERDMLQLEHEVALANFLERVRSNFAFTSEQSSELYNCSKEQLQKLVYKHLQEDIDVKTNIVGIHDLNQIICFDYLRNIDIRWQEHLEQMEALREAVHLRSYAQKNPLVEYKNEGFSIFDEMVDAIEINIAKRFFNIHVSPELRKMNQGPSLRAAQQQHQQLASFSVMKNTNTNNKQQPEKVQKFRQAPKVGRNDPCPCGSGRKYKQCHGR